MNIPVIALIFDRKKKSGDNAPGLIEIRVTAGKIQKYISTGVKILPGHWRGDRIINQPDAATLNDRVSIMRRKVDKYINECVETGADIDLTSLKDIAHADDTTDTFLDFISERAAARNVRASTRKRYEVFINNFERYGKVRKFSDVTVPAVLDYNEWLHRQTVGDNRTRRTGKPTVNDGRKLSEAAIYNYHKCFKLFCNDAYQRGKIKENPYDRIPAGTIQRGETDKMDYLTFEQMQQLQNAKLSTPALERTRDLFVFQMFTGLSYADLAAFDFGDYINDNGVYVHNGHRVKSGVRYFSYLLPPALQILEKYNYQLPIIDNSDYNRNLKMVAAESGLNRRLYSHLARHTFATFMLSRGARLQNVSRMLGHTNTRQTQKYAATLELDVRKDFEAVAKDLTKI